MPQVTLSVPQEKLPILNNVLDVLGIENKSAQKNYTMSVDGVMPKDKHTTHGIFKTYFGWEYFCNELEFE
jgi:hypothetical protein